ncbi:MAG: hypothetical protein ABEN55_12160 [Bradymonadaceae bacterium]
MALPTHENDLTIDIFLEPAPVTREGFGKGLIIDNKSESSLNGNRVKEYSSFSEMETDESNGYLATNILDKGEVWFGQDPTVPEQDSLLVGVRDDTIATPETWDTAVDKIAPNADWYWTLIDKRTTSEIDTVSSHIESNYDVLFVSQDADAEWKNSSPAAGSTPALLSGRERTIAHYHDTDTEHQDVAYAANRGVFDPDEQSAPMHCEIEGVNEIDRTAISRTEINNIVGNNGNVALPFGSTKTFVKRGDNMNGRQAYVLITRDWFRTRLQTDVAVEIQTASNFGEKVPVSKEGQARLAKLVRRRFSQGVAADHFVPGSTNVDLPEIKDSHINNETIPLKGSARIEIAAQDVDFTFRFRRTV